MNQFPSPADYPTAPASQQSIMPSSPSPQRRSQRTKEKKRKKKGFSIPQIAVLSILVLGILICCFSWIQGSNETAMLKNQHLNEKREYDRVQQEYQNQVRRHQVEYEEWIRYYSAVYNLDPAFVAAIIKTESDYQPTAVSNKNARGLMQFMPDTLEWVGPKFGVKSDDLEALNDPETAIKMGCYLLNYITKQFDGDPILTACAYHAGWGNVQGWIKNYSSDGKTLTLSQIPYDNTRNYAGKVLNSYAIYQQYYY